MKKLSLDLLVSTVIDKRKEKKLTLDNSEQLVYASLRLGPKDIDTIAMTCGLPLTETISTVIRMEMDGKLRSLGQNQYMLRL